MKRIVIYSVSAFAAAALAATPAVVGLAGNPSFSHQISVPTPSGAQPVQVVDDHLTVGNSGSDSHSATATKTPEPSRSGHSEPGDDNGGAATRSPEPGDDNGGAATRSPEPGDDNGGAATHSPEPGDDNGGKSNSKGQDDGPNHH